jgi:hypothetical protein
MTQSEQTCYIEFRVHDDNRFQVFERFVRALRARAFAGTPEPVQVAQDATQKGRTYDQPEDWLLLFRPADLATMGMPDHQASLTMLKAWRGLSRGERRTLINKDPMLQMLADFADLVKRLSQVRYRPLTCAKTGRETARMEFTTDEPYFTERESLEDMLLFFGFFNIVDEGC